MLIYPANTAFINQRCTVMFVTRLFSVQAFCLARSSSARSFSHASCRSIFSLYSSGSCASNSCHTVKTFAATSATANPYMYLRELFLLASWGAVDRFLGCEVNGPYIRHVGDSIILFKSWDMVSSDGKKRRQVCCQQL